MPKLTSTKILVTTLLTGAFASVSAWGQPPASHPEYVEARSDLRLARHLIKDDFKIQSRPDVRTQLERAMHETEAALSELDRAISVDEQADLHDEPPIDQHLDRPGRLHHAVDLLVTSYNDIYKQREFDHDAGHWRNIAAKHIRDAVAAVREGAHLSGVDIPIVNLK